MATATLAAAVAAACAHQPPRTISRVAPLTALCSDGSSVDDWTKAAEEMCRKPLGSLDQASAAGLDGGAYRDSQISGGSLSSDERIDDVEVFFLITHGGTDPLYNDRQFQVASGMEPVDLESVRVGNALGDPPASGRLRYWFQCICSLMAHGPRGPNSQQFDAPHRFVDVAGQANVMRAWSSTFGPQMRLACGGSSDLECTRVLGSRVDQGLQAGSAVADAFTTGMLVDQPLDVPLCLTRGPIGLERGDPQPTLPLFDASFVSTPRVTAREPSADPYWIQYPVVLREGFVPPAATEETRARFLSILTEFTNDPISDRFGRQAAKLADPTPVLVDRQLPIDGAVFANTAKAYVIGRFWALEDELTEARVYDLLVDGYEPDCGVDDRPCRRLTPRQRSKGVVVVFRRRIGRGDPAAALLGERGHVAVLLGPQGDVRGAFRDWPRLHARRPIEIDEFRSLEQARSIALSLHQNRRFGSSAGAETSPGIASSTWGFEVLPESPSNDVTMEPVYVFDIVFDDGRGGRSRLRQPVSAYRPVTEALVERNER